MFKCYFSRFAGSRFIERRLKHIIKQEMNRKKSKTHQSFKKSNKTGIDIKKEIALSILNIGEVLTKTIDYYSLDRKDDIDEFMEICHQQTLREKKNYQFDHETCDAIENEIDVECEKNSICDSIETKKQGSKYFDKKSSYSLNQLIQDVDKKIKVLNGIFSSNEYSNLNNENNEIETNIELSKKNTLTKSDTFSYLNESMDFFEEIKQLNEIMNDLNLIIDRNEQKRLNYGSFV